MTNKKKKLVNYSQSKYCEEEADILKIAKKIPFKIFAFAMLGFIIALLILAAHNYGVGKGYTYVQDYYEEYYIPNFCMCQETKDTFLINIEDIENTISKNS